MSRRFIVADTAYDHGIKPSDVTEVGVHLQYVLLRAMKEPRCARVFIEDETIMIILSKDAEIEIDCALEVIAAFLELREFHPYPVLADVRMLKSSSEDAKRLFANNFVQERIPATAFIVSSKAKQAAASDFITASHPKFPTGVFTTEREALQWLRSYKPKRKEG